MTIYSVTVNESDVASIIAALSTISPNPSVAFVPNVSNLLVGVLQVDSSLQSALDAAMQQTPAARNQHVLVQYTANKRWNLQNGGVQFGAIAISTNAASITLINGAVATLTANPTLMDIEFKATSGWVDLTRAQMLAAGAAVGMFYQQCFSAERAIDAKITAGTYTTTSMIDTAVEWPSNVYLGVS